MRECQHREHVVDCICCQEDKKQKERVHQWYLAHKDRVAEGKRQYYLAHRAEVAERKHRYYVTHKEQVLERPRLATRLKKVVAHLHELGVLSSDDLTVIEQQRVSRLPFCERIFYIKTHSEPTQKAFDEAWDDPTFRQCSSMRQRTGPRPSAVQQQTRPAIRRCSHREYVDDCFDCQVRRDSQKEAKHWCDHQYYLAHKDKKAEYRRKWAKANPDKIRASKRRYREHHRDNMAEEDQSRRWLQKDRVAEWSKRWYETHREEIRERDRQKTRLKKLIPYLYERGVLNGDDLFAIQCQRKSRLPISETISYVKERNRTAQEAWNRDEVAEVTHERRTFKMFLSHLHEAGALDDNDLRIITHQRKAHLRRYETISYVGERIRMAPQSRNGPGSQQSENVPDDSFGENREEHISALLAPFKEEGAEEQPYPGDQDVERHDDDTLRGL